MDWESVEGNTWMQIDVTFLDEIVKAILLQKKDYLANALKTEAGRAFLMHEHILNRKTTQKKIMQKKINK